VSAFLIAGLLTGVVYALSAVGLVLMYQTTGVLNVAWGATGAIGAYGFVSLRADIGPWWAYLVVVTIAAAVGLLLGVITLPARWASETAKLVASVGLLTVVPTVVLLAWPDTPRGGTSLSNAEAFTLAGVVITVHQVTMLVVAGFGTAAIYAFFRVGRVGSALRAMAADTEMAELVALPVRRLWLLAWTLVIGASCVSAVLVLPSGSLDTGTLTLTVLPPLAAALAAGFRGPLWAAGIAVLLGVGDGLLASDKGWAVYRGGLPFAVAVVALTVSGSNRFRTWERV
jgi:branched-chain amino acid transport system permease protein